MGEKAANKECVVSSVIAMGNGIPLGNSGNQCPRLPCHLRREGKF